MDELKTLKDIELRTEVIVARNSISGTDVTEVTEYSLSRDLRGEAKKWIKHLKSQENISVYEQDKFDFNNQLDDFISEEDDYEEVISFITWFFNLRHEDLE